MNTAVIFLVVFGAVLVNGQWSQGMSGGMMQGRSQGMSGMMQGRQGMQQGWQEMGQRMAGRSSMSGMDGRYYGRLIDEPTMVGYESSIPGATSRYVQFRSEGGRGGRSGDRGQQDQRSGQGNQWDSGSKW